MAETYRVQHEAVDPLPGWEHHHGGAPVQGVTRSNHLSPGLQGIVLAGRAVCGLEQQENKTWAG